jgi:hypothetical protein
MFHINVTSGFLGLRQAGLVNLTAPELDAVVVPWRAGRPTVVKGKVFEPAKSRLTIYEGPRLTTAQRDLGQGWLNAVKFGEDVTSAMLHPGRLSTEYPTSEPGSSQGRTPTSLLEELTAVVTLIGGGVAVLKLGFVPGVCLSVGLLAGLVAFRRVRELRATKGSVFDNHVAALSIASVALLLAGGISIGTKGSTAADDLDPGTVRVAGTRVANELARNAAALEAVRGDPEPRYVITLLRFDAWTAYDTVLARTLPGDAWDEIETFYESADAAVTDPAAVRAKTVQLLDQEVQRALAAVKSVAPQQ